MQTSHITRGGASPHVWTSWETIGTSWRGWWRAKTEHSPGVINYGTIVLAVLLTALLQYLSPLLPHDGAYFLVFIPAVMTAAFLGGFRFGALVTALSLATSFDAIGEAVDDLAIITNGSAFGIVATGLSVFGDFLRRSHRRANLRDRNLRARTSHLASIIESIPSATIVFDEKGMVQSFNRAAEELFGFPAAEVIGRHADMLTEGAFPGDAKGHAYGRRKDGSRFPLELVLREWHSGQQRYFAGTALDLSEKQRTHARLEALQGDMIHASRVSMLGTMASAMAHELNQPLSAISNYLRGLKYAAANDIRDRPDTMTAILDKTADQALRAGQIIGKLRDLVARGESDRKLASIGKLIADASSLSVMGRQDRPVEVSVRLDPESDLVLVDPVQIQQVLLNLLRNAIEAMADVPHRAIAISTSAGEDMLTVRIEDCGTGIAKEISTRLFEPFTTTKREGMGIGLSISRTIIESHGGIIWHEAVSGGGTAFCFMIPLVGRDENENVEDRRPCRR